MPKFRKRPVVVEAERATERTVIHTLEGDMTAQPGDWIITGVKGEKYPCKPDIFEATYEAVDSEARGSGDTCPKCQRALVLFANYDRNDQEALGIKCRQCGWKLTFGELRRQLHASQQAGAQAKEDLKGYRDFFSLFDTKDKTESFDELMRVARGRVSQLKADSAQLAQAKKRIAELEPKAGEWDEQQAAIDAAKFPASDELVKKVNAELDRQEAERARVPALEEENKRLRGARDALEDDIGEWKEASGLIVGGDPEGVTPSMLEMSRQKDDAEIERLREIVMLCGTAGGISFEPVCAGHTPSELKANGAVRKGLDEARKYARAAAELARQAGGGADKKDEGPMPEQTTVRDILKLWLKDNGYDGLIDSDGECGCAVGDLVLCDEGFVECRPGYQGPDPSGGADFLIYPTREAAVLAQENIDAERHAENEEPSDGD